jgi:hypothetical protein
MKRQISAASVALACLVAVGPTGAAAQAPETGGPPANFGTCVQRLATGLPSAVAVAMGSWAPVTIFFGETYNTARIPVGQVDNGQEMVACGVLPRTP